MGISTLFQSRVRALTDGSFERRARCPAGVRCTWGKRRRRLGRNPRVFISGLVFGLGFWFGPG
ncbi:hypothetical protein ERO13_A05G301100v2 [Gossypium hirsutum]|nr:hypothetical protein ERO13_A05G301100v2 [Gossypium hirsutum]